MLYAQWEADFDDFGITAGAEGERWTYDGSERVIKLQGVHPGDQLDYSITYADGTTEKASAAVQADGSITGEPKFKNFSDTSKIEVTVSRGGKTAKASTAMTTDKVQITVTDQKAVLFDGSQQTLVIGEGDPGQYKVENKAVDGEGLKVTAEVSGTEVGSHTTVVGTGDEGSIWTIENGLIENYDVKVNGTLRIFAQSIDDDDPEFPDPTDPDPDPDTPDPNDPDTPDDTDYYGGVTVNSPSNVPYDGVEHKWAPEVKGEDGQVLTEGTDYTVTYLDAEGNVKTDFTNVTGEITVVITGIGNYSGTVERYYQITPVDLTVTIDNLTKTEGQADPQFGFTTSDGPNVENMVWTGQFERQAGETAGTYAVTGGTFALADSTDGSFLADNYILRVVPGSLTITAAPVPVTPPTPDPTPDDGDDDGTVPVPTPDPADDGTADDPAAGEAIAEAAVPLAAGAGAVAIADEGTPLAGGDHRDCWVHWFMILGIVVTVAYTAGVVGRRSKFSGDLKNFEDKVLGNDQNNQ